MASQKLAKNPEERETEKVFRIAFSGFNFTSANNFFKVGIDFIVTCFRSWECHRDCNEANDQEKLGKFWLQFDRFQVTCIKLTIANFMLKLILKKLLSIKKIQHRLKTSSWKLSFYTHKNPTIMLQIDCQQTASISSINISYIFANHNGESRGKANLECFQ